MKIHKRRKTGTVLLKIELKREKNRLKISRKSTMSSRETASAAEYAVPTVKMGMLQNQKIRLTRNHFPMEKQSL